MGKCSFCTGVEVNIGGIPVDPCHYQTIEIHRNVTVRVMKCKRCGHVEISWIPQENTETVVIDNG